MKTSTVSQYFIKKMLDYGVLEFGQYQLNSGLISDYYFNFSKFNSSRGLNDLGFVYGQTITEFNLPFDVLFGSSYKGIPIVISTTNWFFNYKNMEKDVIYAFNRKEKKTHGEGGCIVGSDIKNKNVLVLDDVLTSGKALRNVFNILRNENVASLSALVGINRNGITSIDGVPIHQIADSQTILEQVNKHKND